MNYNLGLEASKLLAQTLEVALPETEKRWKQTGDRYYIAYKCMGYPNTDEYPSPSLSELSEVFRLLGEKKGWGDRENGWGKIPKWKDRYDDLCQLWRDTQSQEKCDEYFVRLIKK